MSIIKLLKFNLCFIIFLNLHMHLAIELSFIQSVLLIRLPHACLPYIYIYIYIFTVDDYQVILTSSLIISDIE